MGSTTTVPGKPSQYLNPPTIVQTYMPATATLPARQRELALSNPATAAYHTRSTRSQTPQLKESSTLEPNSPKSQVRSAYPSVITNPDLPHTPSLDTYPEVYPQTIPMCKTFIVIRTPITPINSHHRSRCSHLHPPPSPHSPCTPLAQSPPAPPPSSTSAALS